MNSPLTDIGKISRRVISALPKSDHFKSPTAPTESGIQTFRNKSQDHDLALGSEKESTEFNHAENSHWNIGHIF